MTDEQANTDGRSRSRELHVERLGTARTLRHEGACSRQLVSGSAEHLTFTWVELEPGARQRPHVHANSEQAYVCIAGSMIVSVDGARAVMEVGDALLIPKGEEHGVENPAAGPATYIAATSPPADMSAFYEPE